MVGGFRSYIGIKNGIYKNTPAEKVEKFLLQVKGVEEAFVTIDEREVLTAYLVLNKDWLKKAEKREILNIIKEYLKQGLEKFEIPKVFIFKENLQKTDSGKLKR